MGVSRVTGLDETSKGRGKLPFCGGNTPVVVNSDKGGARDGGGVKESPLSGILNDLVGQSEGRIGLVWVKNAKSLQNSDVLSYRLRAGVG